ncbi:AAA family ATPase [Nocardioides bruguierae]|uniref:AAA family ATPase n=1 Tax=Nocardioides bruguierae TaxID=2945102 RepID=A0A9X2D4P0_9ACTN|nr:AAA family ATPase [Nocardioides bruguierae]MCM0618767.1 AAA family ATPase [Nocardioides bruguierae]
MKQPFDWDDEANSEALDALVGELLRQRVFREARRRLDVEARTSAEDGFDAGLLADVLARPAEPPERVEGLIPSEASTLIVAMRKTGKTTLALNLARALILGGAFLGRFPVRPVAGRVAFLNYEVSAAQLARWASELEPQIPRDRLVLVNLRGRRNPLDNDEDRAELAELLRELEVETLIVDPFGRAFSGASQNDSAEVGAWLVRLDLFARGQAGVSDVVLTAHAGWEGERTRGSSALEDWPDSIITLTRDKEGATYFRAIGRDVDVPEDRMEFDEQTRTMSLTGSGSRRQTVRTDHVTALVPAVVTAVHDNPGAGVNDVLTALRATSLSFRDRDVSSALKSATEQLLVVAKPGGPGKKTEHYPSGPRPTPSTLLPGIGSTTPSNPVYRDGVGVGSSSSTEELGRGQEPELPATLCTCGHPLGAALPHKRGCAQIGGTARGGVS